MGLQGVELVVLGYNTPIHNPPAPEQNHLAGFHNHLSMQAGAYQNATWVVGVAKAGREEGCDLLGQSRSSRPRARSSPWRPPSATSWWSRAAIPSSAATTKRRCSTSRAI